MHYKLTITPPAEATQPLGEATEHVLDGVQLAALCVGLVGTGVAASGISHAELLLRMLKRGKIRMRDGSRVQVVAMSDNPRYQVDQSLHQVFSHIVLDLMHELPTQPDSAT